MSTRTRSVLYITGFLFTALAVAMLALPASAAGLGIITAMVVGIGILAATNQNRPVSQLTAYDR